MKKKAVVLYSGGLDSTTCMAIAKADGFEPYAMSFAYGQRHTVELDKAREYASKIGAVKHQVMEIDLRQFGGSALTADLDVPKDQSSEDEIPITYVPARNTVFLSLALALAETLDCRDIFVGVNSLDYSGYPDCRPAFIEAFERMANLATKIGVEQPGAIRRDPDYGPEFLLRYQDRLFFGSDTAPAPDVMPKDWPEFVRKGLFESWGHFDFYPTLDLPAEVARKIYRDNARRVLNLPVPENANRRLSG